MAEMTKKVSGANRGTEEPQSETNVEACDRKDAGRTMDELKEALAAKEAELEAAKAEVEEAKAAKGAAKAEESPDDPSRRVKVRLFKDNGRYKEPLFVRVNDYTAQIPRGVTVEIPYFVAKHIEEMTAQDERTAMLVQELAQDYNGKEARLA